MKKILHKIKNHKNKKLFFKTLLNMLIITFLLTILSGLIYVLINRQSLSLQAGHRLFGGSIFGKHLYNIDMAERFFLYSNSFDNKLEWNNYQLSRVNFIRGNLISAIDYANKELEYFPDNCRTHYIRGLAYSYNNQVDKAISDFEYFNKCFPGSWAGHNDLAWLWFRKGDMNNVVKVLDEVIDNYPNNAWVNNTYGVAQLNLKKYKLAEKHLLLAKDSVSKMTERDWGVAYPGNDPAIYSKGLEAMKKSINDNLKLLEENKTKK